MACRRRAIALDVIRTSGDRIQDRPLAEEGGKGLFTKEIEEALAAGAIDLAVHSSKDMPTLLPDGLDPRRRFWSAKTRATSSSAARRNRSTDLPRGAVLGTASLRRQAMAKRKRPDLAVVSLRGNVETRLKKLDEGVADATLLALAGLKRLGLEKSATAILDAEEFLPAVGQGAIGLEVRANDSKTRDLIARINHADTASALVCERAFLAVLDGSCRTPIGGHATIAGGTLRFRGMVVTPDGSKSFEASRDGSIRDAEKLGADAGAEIKRNAGADFFSKL